MLARIQQVEVDQTRLLVTYNNGQRIIVDVASWIREGGIWSRLADTEFLRKVQVGEGGRYLTWLGELDVCADALLAECATMIQAK